MGAFDDRFTVESILRAHFPPCCGEMEQAEWASHVADVLTTAGLLAPLA